MFFGLTGNEVMARYFRDGIYTHLYMPEVTTSASGAKEVAWKFSFLDLGLNFELEGNFCVDQCAGVVTNMDTGDVEQLKDPGSDEEIRGIVFGGYTRFMEALYSESGIVDARGSCLMGSDELAG